MDELSEWMNWRRVDGGGGGGNCRGLVARGPVVRVRIDVVSRERYLCVRVPSQISK